MGHKGNSNGCVTNVILLGIAVFVVQILTYSNYPEYLSNSFGDSKYMSLKLYGTLSPLTIYPYVVGSSMCLVAGRILQC